MAAKFAAVDDRILAGAEDACGIFDGGIVPRASSDKPTVGGMRFDCGYLSPFFITDPERMEVAFEDARILISEGKISNKKDLLPLLEQIKKIGKPLLIIAEDVEGEALATLVVNKLRGPLQVAAERAPGFGEQRNHLLREIALVTGAKTIGEGIDLQLRNVHISDLGLARKITIDKNHTVVEGRKDRRLSFEPESCAQASV
jgi:chaperonin GroEL